MATLALSVVGQFVGNMITPGIGGIIGRSIGALTGAYIDRSLLGAMGQDTPSDNAPTVSDITVTSSSEGVVINRIYGRARVGGNIIWATYHEVDTVTTSSGTSKGLGGSGSSSSSTSYRYYANFAVALGEGEITRIGRVWADDEEIDLTYFTWRLYLGTETQTPDSLIEAKEGADNAPAYRGLAYIVFERMPLLGFGNHIPQLNFEVFRAVDDFEASVKGVTMIPAAGEFAYSPTEIRVDGGAGSTYTENAHTFLGDSDFTVSLDQLEETLPNCATVSLFVAWFGDDLRCGNCTVEPRIETDNKGTGTTPVSWGVAGLTRSSANEVSEHEGKPAYGGTPSDSTVIAAIKEMRDERGLEVIFTPFLMMDIVSGNTLPDPYNPPATGQAVYPWRGRITCHPAPGEAGSPDQTATAQTQVDAFYGTVTASDFSVSGETVTYSGPSEWSYSRFILHCAALCKAAGGVEAFAIGSEMRGLGWVRDSASTYPFVDYLVTLAAQVKILLPSTELTYAADWSEYFGHQPTDDTGDVYFHLDTLWSDSNIDAVAIDNYWPLSDWRDGTTHLDYVAGWRAIHDPNYLAGNIEGGEGYDWYYASDADRDSQTRTTITDGSGKPWVFRYKGLKDWWQNSHYNRPAGVEGGSPTSWVAESKPIWFTELGCPAIDKGTNQPNVFYDPKSSESFLPYYSKGVRDDLIQREHCRTFFDWYAISANNPTSAVYAAPMVDTARIMLYTWDARPYPVFPAYSSVWADFANWPRGHWLNGRMSSAPLSATVAKILDDADFSDYNVTQLSGSMAGYVVDNLSTARDALQPLEAAFFFDSFESQGTVHFAHRGRAGSQASFTPDDLVESRADAELYEMRRGQETDLPRAAKITYIDSDQDYEQKTAEGRRISGSSGRIAQARLPIGTSYDLARTVAETMVQEAWAARENIIFALPPTQLALEASDVVTFTAANRSWDFRFKSALFSAGGGSQIEALSIQRSVYEPYVAPMRDQKTSEATIYGAPDVAFLDLPLIRGDEVVHAGSVASYASPWPLSVVVYRSPTTSGYELKATLETSGVLGLTQTDFYSGPTSRWDNASTLRVTLSAGTLESAEEILVLGGSNLAAIENASGDWEVIQYTTATLVDTLTYDLTGLLRGQYGTEGAMADPVASGARFVLLDNSVVQVDMTLADIGLPFNWKYGPSSYDISHASYETSARSFDGVGLRPLSPIHVRGVFDDTDELTITWLRRTRTGGDSWDQVEVPLGEDSEAYEVDIMNGAVVERTITTTSETATYTSAQQTTDWGSPQSTYTVRVYQMSASYGRGQYREATIP